VNRRFDESTFLDGLPLEEIAEDDEVAALLGSGGPGGLHDRPTPDYGGHFSSADGLTTKPAVHKVTAENWRIVGSKVIFDRSAGETAPSGTRRLIRPEEVPGAKTNGEYVPLSKRNIAASVRGNPGMWIVPAEPEDAFGLAGTVLVGEGRA
jgi:hypothetical protein